MGLGLRCVSSLIRYKTTSKNDSFMTSSRRGNVFNVSKNDGAMLKREELSKEDGLSTSKFPSQCP